MVLPDKSLNQEQKSGIIFSWTELKTLELWILRYFVYRKVSKIQPIIVAYAEAGKFEIVRAFKLKKTSLVRIQSAYPKREKKSGLSKNQKCSQWIFRLRDRY